MELNIDCPSCKETKLSRGAMHLNGTDIQAAHRCIKCGFWMMVIIPPKDKLEMKLKVEYPDSVQFFK